MLVDVHFKGVFFLTQRLLGLIADGGSIVNISSGLARFTFPERIAYGSVKGAVEVLTRYLALELGPREITVNVVAPGAVATDFNGGLSATTRSSRRRSPRPPRSAATRSPRTSARSSRRCSATPTAG